MALEQIVPKSGPEIMPTVEAAAESGRAERSREAEPLPASLAKPATAQAQPVNNAAPVEPAAQAWQIARAKEIDKILSEGLNDIFLKMSPAAQAAFKLKGEETVKNINLILDQTKIQLKKIIDLIKIWLKMIPGINAFFLEQEAKIKADKIIELKHKF